MTSHNQNNPSPVGRESSPSPYCIFCLKDSLSVSNPELCCSTSQKGCRRKYVGIERFLGVQFRSSDDGGGRGGAFFSFQFCADCELLLDRAAELVGRLRRIELELEWKVGKIKDIMVAADRVPSRIKYVKGYHHHHHHHTEVGKGSEELDQVTDWRRKFVKKCLKRQQRSFPRVKLHKLIQAEEEQQNVENGVLAAPPPPLRIILPVENGGHPCSMSSHLTSSTAAEEPSHSHLKSETPAEPPIIHYNPLLLMTESEPILVLKAEEEVETPEAEPPLRQDHEDHVDAIPDEPREKQPKPGDGDIPLAAAALSSTCSRIFEDVPAINTKVVVGGALLEARQHSSHPTSTSAIIRRITEEGAGPAAQESEDHGHCTSEQAELMEIDEFDDDFDDANNISRPGALDNDDHHDDEPHEASLVKEETTEEKGMECASILSMSRSHLLKRQEEARTENNNESGEKEKELLLRPTTRLLRAQFRCEKCSKTFSSKVKFDSHVETHAADHDDDDDDSNLEDEGEEADPDALSSTGSEYDSDQLESEESCNNEPESDTIVVADTVVEEGQVESRLNMSAVPAAPLSSSTITAPPPLSSEDLPEPRFSCSICEASFSTPYRLQKHYKTHHGTTSGGCGSPLPEVDVHRCTEISCSAYFILPIQLKYHHIRFHSKKKKKTKSVVYSTCPICKARLASKKEAQRHYEMYHEKRKVGPRATFRCGVDQCPAYFVRRQQLAKHRELFHQAASSETARPKLGEHCCTICQIDFSSAISVRQHFRSHHDTRPYQVRRCGEAGCSSVYFVTPEELDRHQESVHGRKPVVHQNTEGTIADQSPHASQGGSSLSLPGTEGGGRVIPPKTLPKFSASHWCSICKTEYSSAVFLKEHHALCHDLTDVVNSASVKRCSQPGCSAHFRTSHQLSVHLLRVHGASLHNRKRKYACSGCEKRFTELWALQGHFAAFHERSGALQGPDAELHKCDQPSCTAYFLQRGQLERHRGAAHGKYHECTDCGKEFRFRKFLNFHRLQVHKLKVDLAFRCEVDPSCGKSFETEVDLQNHKRYWHNEKRAEWVKPVACPKCDKVCNGQDALRAHLLSHDRDKNKRPWICEQCGKAFTEKYRLDRHYKAHAGTDSWEFQCSTCGKRCLTKGKLEEHLRTHRGEKPYTCQHCGVSYAHRHNLRIHVNSKHPEAPDLPRAIDKTNLTSRKGVKLKKKK